MAIKSMLRYPGAKGKAMPFLLSKMPDDIKDWREPFFGGGSVTIGFLQSPKSKNCERFVVGDLYPEVYSFWQGVKTAPEAVIEQVYAYMKQFMPHQAEGGEIYTATKNKEDPLVAQAIEEGKNFWTWGKSIDKSTERQEDNDKSCGKDHVYGSGRKRGNAVESKSEHFL